MMISRLKIVFLFLIAASGLAASAQEKPIGYWTSYFPYNTTVGVATDGTQLFSAGTQAFFTYRFSDRQFETYSKVEGMSDIGMQCITYDPINATTALVYSNGNIDLFKDNTFYNIPDLKIKATAGDKTVYQAYAANGRVYLSSAMGVLVLDVAKKQVAETYQFYENNIVIPVKSIVNIEDSVLLAVTTKGIYRVNRNNPAIQNYQVWRKTVTADSLTGIAAVNGIVYVSAPHSVLTYQADTLSSIYSTIATVQKVDAGTTALLVSEYFDSTARGVVRMMTGTAITDTFNCNGRPVQAVQTADNNVWIASPVGGLQHKVNNDAGPYSPTGPTDFSVFDLYAHKGDLYIAHGGYDDRFTPDTSYKRYYGVSSLIGGKWHRLQQGYSDPFYQMRNVVNVLRDETDGTLFVGSFVDGLLILKADGTYEKHKDDVFDVSQQNNLTRQVLGIAQDSKKNLWVSTMFSTKQLYARDLDGQWYTYYVPSAHWGGQMLVDKNDQVWFINSDGGGVTVYDANGTLADKTDDAYYHLTAGAGSGNLPDNNVYSIARDKNNNIWVGTANGIGIVNHCSSPYTTSAPCDADWPIVQYDQFAGYLFAGNAVRTIAVDGANRKWVGTDDGVWLLSADASQIVFRFTKDNSPLPSNTIRKISIDDVTGDVYIGTDIGVVSFRSTATEGGTTNNDVISYPNPVPSGYTGTIAIRGLVANADVRITDIDGQLVYRTKALGGQAVWSGKDYTGHRPQSGVYLIFVTNSDGTQTYTGKMVFMQ
jgi:ligand-binding sensor domain-containing protein